MRNITQMQPIAIMSMFVDFPYDKHFQNNIKMFNNF